MGVVVYSRGPGALPPVQMCVEPLASHGARSCWEERRPLSAVGSSPVESP